MGSVLNHFNSWFPGLRRKYKMFNNVFSVFRITERGYLRKSYKKGARKWMILRLEGRTRARSKREREEEVESEEKLCYRSFPQSVIFPKGREIRISWNRCSFRTLDLTHKGKGTLPPVLPISSVCMSQQYLQLNLRCIEIM